MEIRAYIYIETHDRTLCFRCAVKEIIAGNIDNYNLALEGGDTGDGNDMRSTLFCIVCGERFKDFCIA